MTRVIVALVALVGVSTVSGAPGAPEFTARTRWVMGTSLRIQLPTSCADRDAVFAACFEAADHWDRLLSPWQPDAPLTRLSREAGAWVDVPGELLDYLERSVSDARRTGGVFDITLTSGGSPRIEIDRAGSRARIPAGSGALDPGGDGKGVALDAIAVILDQAGVEEALADFGGSSFLARGEGPDGTGWAVALSGVDGKLLGTLRLVDTALSVSSSVQRREGEDGAVVERFHLVDLSTGELVRERRSVAVLSRSATEAEVLSTAVTILGVARATEEQLAERFGECAVGVFGAGNGERNVTNMDPRGPMFMQQYRENRSRPLRFRDAEPDRIHFNNVIRPICRWPSTSTTNR